MPSTLTFEVLQNAVAHAVALRAVQTLQPAAGPGTKVFPPTYLGSANNAAYAHETRRIDGQDIPCVLLDSVASQANRMEEALRDLWLDREATFPVLSVDFTEADKDLPESVGVLTTLDTPHRVYDAIFRDAIDASGKLFRSTQVGQDITSASIRDAGALYTYCPTALIFGAWDSTGPKGGNGNKFPRILASEIVGVGVVSGTKVEGRIDPLQIEKAAGDSIVVSEDPDEMWKIGSTGKKRDPSNIGHGNQPPSLKTTVGGVTFDYAQQTTVFSIPALKRLRFGTGSAESAQAAHTALAALALLGITAAHAQGHDLRSGTLLVAQGPLTLEVVDATGAATAYKLGLSEAIALLDRAREAAGAAGLPWTREPMAALKPSAKFIDLVQKSQNNRQNTYLKGVK